MAQIPLPKLLKRKKRQTKAVKGAKRRRDNTVKRLVRKVKSGAHPNNIAKWRQNRRERNADLQEARGKRSYTDQQIKRAKQASTRPSPNFAYAEFDCKDGTPVPKASYPALDFLCTTYLEPLREKFGAVRVTSGHRHERYNANLRPPGATQSLHIYDFPVSAVEPTPRSLSP